MIVSGVTMKMDQRRPGKHAAQHREQRLIGGTELGSLDLAAQHLELVAEHGDLDVLGLLDAQASQQHADKPACHEVEEGQGHRPGVPDRRGSGHADRPRRSGDLIGWLLLMV
jgi:hypothetical protein